MKNNFFIVLTLLIFCSCQPILMKMYGIKDPEIESEAKIKKTALKYHLDTSNIVTVNSKDFLNILNGKSIPDASIYDRQGKYIEYRKTDTSCNAGLFEFIPALNLADKYHQPDSSSLQNQLIKLRDLKGVNLQPLTPADFYILIYWTVWTGKLNKDHVKMWEDLAKNNKKSKIKVLKVNLDIQEYWDHLERDKIIKTIGKKK